jgi:type II secretory pathway component PulF
MLFSPRITAKQLAALCRTLAVSTAAGIEDRKTWRGEAERSSGPQGAAAETVSDALARGESITDALAQTGEFYPPLFKQVVAVGDVSGQLDRAYRQLAEHYEHSVTAQRAFLSGLAWPMIQLVMAAMVVGLLIMISNILPVKTLEGEPLDMLGFGLVGFAGLALYLLFIAAAVGGILLLIASLRRGAPWTRKVQAAAAGLPVIGDAFQTLAMAQFTWALQLVSDTPMDLRRALPLALEASGNDRYATLGPKVATRIQQGATIYEALHETGQFPLPLLNAIDVGEQTGMLAETMQRQAREYQERAAMAIKIIAQALGYVVWAVVAGIIIMLIFRLAGFYTGTIESLTKPMR